MENKLVVDDPYVGNTKRLSPIFLASLNKGPYKKFMNSLKIDKAKKR